jgi:membrane fusion protein, multidrug efflux system
LHTALHSALRLVWRLVTALLGVALLAVVIAWMSGSFRTKVEPGEMPDRRPAPAGRELVDVKSVTMTEYIDAVGTVEPRRKVAVASLLLGTIQEVKVNAGDRVERDQLLVTLDDRELQAQLHEAEAAVAAAGADLATRERDYTRYKRMYTEKSVTGEDYDRVEGAYQVAVAQHRRAGEQVRRLEVMLSYTRIRAPSAGIVADRFADPGDLAAPGKPLLALHDPGERDLHASVREGLARYIRPGMKLPVQIDAVSLNLEGVVREIVPQAMQASRTVLVKVSLPPDKTTGLYNGMFGRISIPIGTTERMVIPADAVQHVGELDIVEVADAAGGLERRFVRTGRNFDGKLEILSGLDVGERIALPAAKVKSPAREHTRAAISPSGRVEADHQRSPETAPHS